MFVCSWRVHRILSNVDLTTFAFVQRSSVDPMDNAGWTGKLWPQSGRGRVLSPCISLPGHTHCGVPFLKLCFSRAGRLSSQRARRRWREGLLLITNTHGTLGDSRRAFAPKLQGLAKKIVRLAFRVGGLSLLPQARKGSWETIREGGLDF